MLRSARMRSIVFSRSDTGYIPPVNIALAVAPDIAGFGVLSLELRFTVSRSIAHMGKVT